MKYFALIILLIAHSYFAAGQEPEHAFDSSDVLDEVIVRGYENNRKLIEVPAPITVISKTQLNRFNNISLLPAINTAPGVRMEERSPGSYRLNIRGSSLRSPLA